MKAADLRKAILQAAVQGKLVPQNKNDEPASELLKRIQAEKIALIKNGKLKKEKPLPPIAEDEIPYDLPDGWVWCRLNESAIIATGSTPLKSDATYYHGNIPWIMSASTNEDFITSADVFVTPKAIAENHLTINPAGTLVMAMYGQGKTRGQVSELTIEAATNQACATICTIIPAGKRYIKIYLKKMYFEIRELAEGGAQPNLNLLKIKCCLVPMPPLAEQQRIVAKVDKLMAMCDELESAEKELDALEDRFAEYLPKSILQAAVRGKLVSQDKNDEPAAELLKRIQKEKAQLVKDGKLKKEKPLPPITVDEIPYDLPDGWEWCRFGELIQLLSGRDLAPNEYNDQGCGIPYVTGASALINNNIDIVRWTECPSVTSIYSDVLLSCKGTIGKIVHNTIGDCHIARQIMAIRILSAGIDRHYIAIALETFVAQLLIQARSMIPGISRDDVTGLLFPFPPHAEQQRIVTKVDELMALCEKLEQARTMPIAEASDRVIPFPAAVHEQEPLGMAARGAADNLSPKAKQTIAHLFEEDD